MGRFIERKCLEIQNIRILYKTSSNAPPHLYFLMKNCPYQSNVQGFIDGPPTKLPFEYCLG